ncbi:MAG: heavy metal response regulator transcription factor [Tepidisphaeraceae bacterium]
MRVILIEDDIKLSSSLQKGLAEQHIRAECVGSGTEALRVMKASAFDAAVLDVMLPGLDGWEVLNRLRIAGDKTPVIVLSARDALADRVKGLNSGADDYLVKPFAFAELVARIHTIVRRGPVRTEDVIRLADLQIDLRRHKVARDNQPIELTSKEFLLLSLLARRAGDVLSRRQIAEQVWDMNFDSDANTVDVAIRRLRSKIDDPYPTKLIRTVRGVGYVLDKE